MHPNRLKRWEALNKILEQHQRGKEEEEEEIVKYPRIHEWSKDENMRKKMCPQNYFANGEGISLRFCDRARMWRYTTTSSNGKQILEVNYKLDDKKKLTEYFKYCSEADFDSVLAKLRKVPGVREFDY